MLQDLTEKFTHEAKTSDSNCSKQIRYWVPASSKALPVFFCLKKQALRQSRQLIWPYAQYICTWKKNMNSVLTNIPIYKCRDIIKQECDEIIKQVINWVTGLFWFTTKFSAMKHCNQFSKWPVQFADKQSYRWSELNDNSTRNLSTDMSVLLLAVVFWRRVLQLISNYVNLKLF